MQYERKMTSALCCFTCEKWGRCNNRNESKKSKQSNTTGCRFKDVNRSFCFLLFPPYFFPFALVGMLLRGAAPSASVYLHSHFYLKFVNLFKNFPLFLCNCYRSRCCLSHMVFYLLHERLTCLMIEDEQVNHGDGTFGAMKRGRSICLMFLPLQKKVHVIFYVFLTHSFYFYFCCRHCCCC
uniref:WGS project CAEQ00000000 data, annotated contig 2155 n=1 Tax=Trypanosoma congolense (strain IL3000) TaxID=1068625 RepID=F9WBW9_TRYCI|nr:unnamed protein product [Trypanosoma congolense IL3000]